MSIWVFGNCGIAVARTESLYSYLRIHTYVHANRVRQIICNNCGNNRKLHQQKQYSKQPNVKLMENMWNSQQMRVTSPKVLSNAHQTAKQSVNEPSTGATEREKGLWTGYQALPLEANARISVCEMQSCENLLG